MWKVFPGVKAFAVEYQTFFDSPGTTTTPAGLLYGTTYWSMILAETQSSSDLSFSILNTGPVLSVVTRIFLSESTNLIPSGPSNASNPLLSILIIKFKSKI